MGKLSNHKQEAFCQEFMRDRNRTKAALRAGYSAKTAKQQGTALYNRDDIRDRICELEQEYIRSVKLDVEKVLARYAEIATADPRELTKFRRQACRYCHGNNHEYHWRTQAEFQNAMNVWNSLPPAKRGFPPTDDGGYGYTKHLDPVDECPMCDGDGNLELVLPDTSTLSAKGAALFAGIKETRQGIEIKMHDQMAALDAYARHLNLFAKHEDDERVDAFADMLSAISRQGSTAPIRDEGEEIDA